MLLDSALPAQVARVRRSPEIGEILRDHPELAIDRDEYNINVTANGGQRLNTDEVRGRYAAHDGSGKPAHLYFHVPLCTYVCHFCNYVKKLLPRNGNEDAVLDRWVTALIEESRRQMRAAPWLRSARIESIYIGGGTASLLRARHLTRLLGHVRGTFDLASCVEITLEGNPDNFLRDEIAAAIDLGFNRFSVGVQSLQSEVNQFAGRGHDADMSCRAIGKLVDSGCPFNVDMMFGLPHQTVERFAHDIEALLKLGAPTITLYRLRNADRQKMGIGNRAVWNQVHVRDRLDAAGLFPTLEQTYGMREAAVEALLARGYWPSPCGWWSAPGTYPGGNIPHVSRNKWERHDTMVACGPGAYGWLVGGDGTITQTHNDPDIGSHLQRLEQGDQLPLANGRLLSGRSAVATALGFAYKANQPIQLCRFRRQFGVDLTEDEPYASVIRTLLDSGFLTAADDGATLSPTLRGEAVHEEIISAYIHHRIGKFAAPVCRRAGA